MKFKGFTKDLSPNKIAKRHAIAGYVFTGLMVASAAALFVGLTEENDVCTAISGGLAASFASAGIAMACVDENYQNLFKNDKYELILKNENDNSKNSKEQ